MPLTQNLIRLSLAAALLGSLGACTVVPAYPVSYRAAPAYVEPYPVYRYGTSRATIYYESNPRHYDNRSGYYGRDDGRHDERRYRESRRILGLPHLPGRP